MINPVVTTDHWNENQSFKSAHEHGKKADKIIILETVLSRPGRLQLFSLEHACICQRHRVQY